MSPTGTNARQPGMSAKICASGLNDDTNMKRIGPAKITTRKTRSTWVPTSLIRLRRRASAAVISGAGAGAVTAAMSHLLSCHVALDHRDRENQDEEEQRDRGGISGLLLLVAGADGHEDHGRGRVERAALGHHADLREQAQRGDRDRDQDERPGCQQAWPGDVPEPVPARGAVDG